MKPYKVYSKMLKALLAHPEWGHGLQDLGDFDNCEGLCSLHIKVSGKYMPSAIRSEIESHATVDTVNCYWFRDREERIRVLGYLCNKHRPYWKRLFHIKY